MYQKRIQKIQMTRSACHTHHRHLSIKWHYKLKTKRKDKEKHFNNVIKVHVKHFNLMSSSAINKSSNKFIEITCLLLLHIRIVVCSV